MQEVMENTLPCVQKDGADADTARRVLFVCTGNTCRSPMAAALLNEQSAPREICSACAPSELRTYLARSAGLYAASGAPITPAAVMALEEAGVASTPYNDYRAHRAHSVTEGDVEWADVIVAITAAHAMELMLRFPDAASKIRTLPMDIADPYGGSAQDYRDCLLQLRYCLQIAFFGAEDTP